jgi:hypothetical protein
MHPSIKYYKGKLTWDILLCIGFTNSFYSSFFGSTTVPFFCRLFAAIAIYSEKLRGGGGRLFFSF